MNASLISFSWFSISRSVVDCKALPCPRLTESPTVPMSQHATQSHYPTNTSTEKAESHTLSVVVDNEPGVLARVIGLFSGRGYNIDSLTVSETEHEKHLSRITIVTKGTPMVIVQIKHQLERMIPVHRVTDLTLLGDGIERELALVKVVGTGEKRVEALRLAQTFEARTVDATLTSFVFELTGEVREIERFIKVMTSVGLVEVSRTGVAAIGRGSELA